MNVTVEPEQDYPPTANAGYNQLIRLPKNEVIINGSQSTDDKVQCMCGTALLVMSVHWFPGKSMDCSSSSPL